MYMYGLRAKLIATVKRLLMRCTALSYARNVVERQTAHLMSDRTVVHIIGIAIIIQNT